MPGHRKPLPSAASAEDVIDLSHEIIRRARDEAHRLAKSQQTLVSIATANRLSQQRLNNAILLVLAARSGAEISQFVRRDFPAILDLAAALLIAPDDAGLPPDMELLQMPAGYMSGLLGEGQLWLGPPTGLQREIFRHDLEAPPPSCALIALPKGISGIGAGMILALAGHSAESFTAEHGTELVEFTARLLAVGLAARPLLV